MSSSGRSRPIRSQLKAFCATPTSILEGRVRHEYGPDLQFTVDHEAGDFIFIEPGVPHEVLNVSDTQPVVAVVSRSSAAEWDDIVDYPSRRRPAKE